MYYFIFQKKNLSNDNLTHEITCIDISYLKPNTWLKHCTVECLYFKLYNYASFQPEPYQ